MKQLQLRIIQTSDLHGYVLPKSYATKIELPLGLSKVATFVRDHRNENTLVIDTGDTIQGSPLTYYLSKANYNTNPLATIMNYIGYDYITIGNHEFNYGLDYLDSYLGHVNAKILNANILTSNKPLYGNKYDIVKIDGFTIGIIGVTTHYIPNWEQPSNIKDITFLDAFSETKKLAQELKPQVDFLIVNYHGGFERDLQTNELIVEDTGENQGSKMLNEIPEIDLLLTGHQHRNERGVLNNTHYIQPGFNGGSVGLIDITLTEESSTVLKEVIYLNDIEPDQTVLDIIQEAEEQTNEYLDQTVGYLEEDLLIENHIQALLNKHPIVSFINQVQLDYTKADISCCSLGNDVSGFNKEITIRDVISTYIYPNTLVIKEITGQVLLEALEKNAEFFTIENNQIVVAEKYKYPKLQLYNYDMYDGISYTINLSKVQGHRISDVMVQDKPLDLNKTYTIALNNYRAAGGGDYTMYKNAPTVKDTQKEILEVLIDYIVRVKNLTINHTDNITIKKDA
jgi:2',3'-cyclic-nucleotide 2'-phosphodiesterase/3'-nucleotidase